MLQNFDGNAILIFLNRDLKLIFNNREMIY